MLALVLSLLGIVAGFFVIELGIIVELIAFFVAKKKRKNKEKYSNSAYYISLIVGLIQLIFWVVSLISISNIIKDTQDKVNDINNKYESRLDASNKYIEECGKKYDKYEDYNECINKVDECFEKNEQLDEAKKCVNNSK